ncbi:MAG: carbohydrate kinase family protein [Chloroflexota bacterium]
MTDPNYIAYGKIHIDNIQQMSRTTSYLGGGGPQAAYGMRLWSDHVGFLTRSGTDIAPQFEHQLRDMQIDLAGWKRFEDLPTPLVDLIYDEEERLISANIRDREAWLKMMRTPIPLPGSYQQAKTLHLVTEWADMPVVQVGLDLQQRGGIFSLEPLLDNEMWFDEKAMIDLIGKVDCVTPDFPSASRLAGRDTPLEVLKFWAGLGANMVAIRDGVRGSYVWSKEEDIFWHVPPVPVSNVVDPTGAGNAYGGGLCVGWTETGDARTAAAYGTTAAYSLLHVPGLPAIHSPEVQAAKNLLQQVVDSAAELIS